jgi:teichuronic acid biosynthesis protein TuaE
MSASNNIDSPSHFRGISWQSIIPLFVFTYALFEFVPVLEYMNTSLLSILFLICIFLHFVKKRNIIISNHTAEVYILMLVWLSYCIFSVVWSNNPKLAFEYGKLILRYWIIFIIFSQFFLSLKRQKQLIYFYQIVILIYLGISIWELYSGQHLPTSRYYGKFIPIPSGPFLGENLLAAFLLILLPYLSVPLFFMKKSWALSILSMVLTILIFLLTILVGARIVFVAITIGCFVYVIRWASAIVRISLIVLMVTIPLYFVQFQPNIWRLMVSFAKEQYVSIHSEAASVTVGSVKIRERLVKHGLDMFIQSKLIGIGGGNFEDYMLRGKNVDTSSIINPHNYGIEILSDFGIFIFLGFLYIYFYWLYCLWKLYRHGEKEKQLIYRAHFFSLLFFIPASDMPSSIRASFLLCIYLAGIHSACVTGMAKLKENSNINSLGK